MFIKRSSSAIWQGPGKDGKGSLSTGSNFISHAPYSFNSRFEKGSGTNPEELIAAAHAGCYSMALSFFLAIDGIKSDQIETYATVTVGLVSGEIEITTIHLKVTGKVPGLNQTTFKQYAEKAKTGCAVSKVLKAKISLECYLEL